MLLLRDNREFRSTATQDGLGPSGLSFFSLLSPQTPNPYGVCLLPQSLPPLAGLFCIWADFSPVLSLFNCRSLSAAFLPFLEGCSALRDEDQYPPSLGTSRHAAWWRGHWIKCWGCQQLLSSFACVPACWCRKPRDSICILPGSPCPCSVGGSRPAVSAPW